ncbi:hypothetical protein KIN20_008261 [Parelaphostrongylus tenuis]|uniref:Uncharacterized protein n=1 Tax=Parelaphostrongylus tenuis TaxID=148309 RepID=A0AAD5M4I6_PARTN|nr:hypothetical protein KIN20_008256 [Parelaphostrongylus tenuis]KAJ1352072.1 hypothetical protein KIN20_008261 [Parelaphostrongylus tenuis]
MIDATVAWKVMGLAVILLFPIAQCMTGRQKKTKKGAASPKTGPPSRPSPRFAEKNRAQFPCEK